MSVSEKGDDGLVGGQLRGAPGPDADRSEFILGADQKPEVRAFDADPVEALRLKNRQVKIQMSKELVRMGFSREAAARILNMDFDREETV